LHLFNAEALDSSLERRLFFAVFGLLGVDLVFQVPGFGVQECSLLRGALFDVGYYLGMLGFEFLLKGFVALSSLARWEVG
jgi:hypothetical protein